VNDDVFTPYRPGRTLRNLVIWKQMNQAVFQLGSGYPQTVTDTERGRWWGPFRDRAGQPMRSRLRTADPGKIRVRFDDVSIGGVRLESEPDFPNGLETQGDVILSFDADE